MLRHSEETIFNEAHQNQSSYDKVENTFVVSSVTQNSDAENIYGATQNINTSNTLQTGTRSYTAYTYNKVETTTVVSSNPDVFIPIPAATPGTSGGSANSNDGAIFTNANGQSFFHFGGSSTYMTNTSYIPVAYTATAPVYTTSNNQQFVVEIINGGDSNNNIQESNGRYTNFNYQIENGATYGFDGVRLLIKEGYTTTLPYYYYRNVSLDAAHQIMNGGAGDDILSGGGWSQDANGNDAFYVGGGFDFFSNMGNRVGSFLYGGSGNDTLIGTALADELIGGEGNDTLNGAAGADTYRVLAGANQGWDTIDDSGYIPSFIEDGVVYPILSYGGQIPTDTVVFEAGIRRQDLQFSWESPTDEARRILNISWGEDSGIHVVVTLSSVDLEHSVVFGGFAGSVGIENFQFADGISMTMAEILALAPAMPESNQAPTVFNILAAQAATEDTAFSFTIPTNSFNDADIGDSLTYSVVIDDGTEAGAALPNWLSYDADTLTISGTPLNDDVGNISLKVTATDVVGASANQTFGLSISNTNDAPVLVGSIANQLAVDDEMFSLVIPTSLFLDVDQGDQLSYTLKQADGTTLPSWLSFDATTRLLSGTPYGAKIGNNFSLMVTATDLAGTSADAAFSLTVNQMPDQMLNGTTANDALTGGSGNDTLDGGAGADKLIGGLGNDTYIVDNLGDVITENANAGNDTVLSSITYSLVAQLNVENLTLTGTAAINAKGNTLNNQLTGNTANNTLNGGSGADTMAGGLGNDSYIVDNIGDVVIENEAEGTDTVQSSISYTLGANLENLTLTGTAAINGTGNDLNNSIKGNSAVNILTGGIGNDTLNGGAGADTLIGGLGNDVYVVDNIGDVVIENVDVGTDMIQTSITLTGLAANVENLTLTGTATINATGNELDNVLTGNSAANILDGGAGNDMLNGGTGADTLIGGLGNDTYIIDNIGDVVAERLNEGTDTVNSKVTYTLTANVENLILTGTAAINATGNELDNILTGNTGNNILNGGLGADSMAGGAGNDTYVVDNIGDVVTEAAGAGTDLVQSSISYTLADNVENLTLTVTSAINGTGNTLNNLIIGNAANNILDGGAGNDTLKGGAGDDVYIVDSTTDVVTELANEGTDTIQISVTLTTLSANVENLMLTGFAAINGKGNSLNNAITGNAADNILNGGTGADTLIGGTGNDTYVIDNVGDIIIENDNEGMDTVKSTITTTLGNYLENLTLTGSAAINGTGNALNNYLLGNTGNNTLNGLGGFDILQSLAGNDTLTDTMDNNLLDSGAGTDTLTAGAGNDLLIGGQGNDTITTGTGYDVIVFNKGDGQDIINASTGADNTISLGGNFAYSDLSLTKSTNNLILKMGATDQITLKDWYLTSPTNKSVINLQVIAEAMDGFTLGGADALRDNKIENFNFANIVAAFDTAGATANWQLTDARLTTYLQAGSDTAAIGGDLAYQYGRNSNLTGIGLTASQSVINATSFGQTAQTLNSPTTWAAETVKLG